MTRNRGPGNDRELLFSVSIHDCKVQTFRCGGPGGQNLNTRDTGVRVIHEISGAVGESREQRSQLQNKKTAFRRMTETAAFKIWMNRKYIEMEIGTPEKRVAREMNRNNLRIEGRKDGEWVLIP